MRSRSERNVSREEERLHGILRDRGRALPVLAMMPPRAGPSRSYALPVAADSRSVAADSRFPAAQ
eukprot:2933198-Pleurochrysis_carterae.AAC.1